VSRAGGADKFVVARDASQDGLRRVDEFLGQAVDVLYLVGALDEVDQFLFDGALERDLQICGRIAIVGDAEDEVAIRGQREFAAIEGHTGRWIGSAADQRPLHEISAETCVGGVGGHTDDGQGGEAQATR